MLLAIVLAALTAWMIVWVLVSDLPRPIVLGRLPPAGRLTLGLGVPAAAVLWGWMALDCLRHPPRRLRIFWPLVLLLALHLGALAYCAAVYLPALRSGGRERHPPHADYPSDRRAPV